MTAPGSGRQLAGRYHLVELIDRGALGEVWQARDEKLLRPVALKLIRPELAMNAAFRTAFGEEARAWAAVSHPGTAWVYDFGEQPPTQPGGPPVVYLVTELVEGASLQVLLDQSGPLSAVVTMDLLAQAASTLHAAHQGGLVHGNIKPSNLLLRGDGELKVTDFGMARRPQRGSSGRVPLRARHGGLLPTGATRRPAGHAALGSLQPRHRRLRVPDRHAPLRSRDADERTDGAAHRGAASTPRRSGG